MDKNKIQSVFLLIILSLIWGTSFILIKKGLVGYSADQVGALRIVIAGLVFVPYMLKNFREVDFSLYKYIFIFAVMELGLPPFLYSYAQTVVNSGTAGILNSLVPLFTLFTGLIIFKVATNFLKVLGVLIGLLGAVLLVFFETGDFQTVDFANSWGLLIVLATLLYGLGSNILKEYLQNVSDMDITSIAFISIGIPAFIYLLTTDFFHRTFTDATVLPSFAAVAVLSVLGSALAMFLFTKLVKKSSALFASFVTYLIPFVAMIWSLLDGEGITFIQIISLLLILSGIYIANIGMRKNGAK